MFRSAKHPYNIRFADKHNFSTSKTQWNVYTFKSISSKTWGYIVYSKNVNLDLHVFKVAKPSAITLILQKSKMFYYIHNPICVP